ncbi:MAG TPA: zf-HC2 domain-containing protein [Actinomycetota bacterium]|nr:zf-HC2 domain-containing protein [Actinomycetota bacterium]
MSPIDCREALEQIELYLDGELEGAVRIEIEEHLGGCSPCMDHSEFQRRLKLLVRSRCGCGVVPEEVARRIRSLFTEPDRR